ncbi:MAG TPA: hypothetical protein VNC41_13155, partial [Acidimicrobiia bacterium]|nr:hypothetical protein [Acidimicrobiia bacterium]
MRAAFSNVAGFPAATHIGGCGLVYGFGIESPDQTREMFDEVVGEFRKMWAPGEYAGFQGSSFSMPARNV